MLELSQQQMEEYLTSLVARLFLLYRPVAVAVLNNLAVRTLAEAGVVEQEQLDNQELLVLVEMAVAQTSKVRPTVTLLEVVAGKAAPMLQMVPMQSSEAGVAQEPEQPLETAWMGAVLYSVLVVEAVGLELVVALLQALVVLGVRIPQEKEQQA